MALDPAHLTATTSAIAAVIFSKALEKSGEQMGEAVYQKVGQLIQSVRDQFQKQGSIETLTEAEENPSEQNITQFTKELGTLMSEDETFAESIERSLSVVSEDIELKKILSQADLDHDYWSSQPLSVEQFKEPSETENPELKKPLKVSQPPSET